MAFLTTPALMSPSLTDSQLLAARLSRPICAASSGPGSCRMWYLRLASRQRGRDAIEVIDGLGLGSAVLIRLGPALGRASVGVSDPRRATCVQHHRRTEPSATNAANAGRPQDHRNRAVTSTANDGRKTFTRQGADSIPASPSSRRFVRTCAPASLTVRRESANQLLTNDLALMCQASGGAVFVDFYGRGGGI
jgi:hypothetical protein